MSQTPLEHAVALDGIKPVSASQQPKAVRKISKHELAAQNQIATVVQRKAANEAAHIKRLASNGLRHNPAAQRSAKADAVLLAHLSQAKQVRACAERIGKEHPLIKSLSAYLTLADAAEKLEVAQNLDLGVAPSLPMVDRDYPLATKETPKRSGSDAMRDALPHLTMRELEAHIPMANEIARGLIRELRGKLEDATGVNREIVLTAYTSILEEILTIVEDWSNIVEARGKYDQEKYAAENKAKALQASIAGLSSSLNLAANDRYAISQLETKMYELSQADKQSATSSAKSATKSPAKASAKATKQTTNKDD